MKKGTWKPYVFAVVLTEAVGALAGFLTLAGGVIITFAKEILTLIAG